MFNVLSTIDPRHDRVNFYNNTVFLFIILTINVQITLIKLYYSNYVLLVKLDLNLDPASGSRRVDSGDIGGDTREVSLSQ